MQQVGQKGLTAVMFLSGLVRAMADLNGRGDHDVRDPAMSRDHSSATAVHISRSRVDGCADREHPARAMADRLTVATHSDHNTCHRRRRLLHKGIILLVVIAAALPVGLAAELDAPSPWSPSMTSEQRQLSQNNPLNEPCKCAEDGVSGGISTGVVGCVVGDDCSSHVGCVDITGCYVVGGARCTSASPSNQYPGASWRPCNSSPSYFNITEDPPSAPPPPAPPPCGTCTDVNIVLQLTSFSGPYVSWKIESTSFAGGSQYTNQAYSSYKETLSQSACLAPGPNYAILFSPAGEWWSFSTLEVIDMLTNETYLPAVTNSNWDSDAPTEVR
eukprot:4141539-Prymnesium_polylepis.1